MLIGLSGQAGSGKDYIANLIKPKFGKYQKIAFADEVKRIAKGLWDFSEESLWGPSYLRNIPDKRYLLEEYNYHKAIFIQNHGGWFPEQTLCNRCNHLVDKTIGKCQKYLTPRMALQGLGASIRKIDKDVWVRFTINIAEKLLTRKITHEIVPMSGTEYAYNDEYHTLMYDPARGLGNHVYNTYPESITGVIISDQRYINEFEGIAKAGGKLVRIKSYKENTALGEQEANHESEIEQLEIPDSEYDFIFYNTKNEDVLRQRINEMMTILDAK